MEKELPIHLRIIEDLAINNMAISNHIHRDELIPKDLILKHNQLLNNYNEAIKNQMVNA